MAILKVILQSWSWTLHSCPFCKVQVHVQKSGYKKLPVGIATTTDQPSVAAAFKTNSSGESDKSSVDSNVYVRF